MSGTAIVERPLVILSGCSGGGKSTLLDELARRGHRTFEEPGRRIVREALQNGGDALPDRNPVLFAERCIALCIAQFDEVDADGPHAFCDRSIIDAVSFLEAAGSLPAHLADAAQRYRYAPIVFLTPPWPEIFTSDTERQHGIEAAVEEYERLVRDFPRYGYETVVLPKAPVAERAEIVLKTLGR